MIRFFGVIILVITAAVNCNAVEMDLPSPVIPDCLGVNIHFAGREDQQVDQIAKAGFRFIRMDFSWANVEKKKGEYNFKIYDDLVDSLASRGIRPLFILDYGNPLYDNDMAPSTDEGRAAFAAFAKASAAHFKGKNVLWEIWNEPNGFWHPQPNVEDYVKLAKVVYPALKQADSKCTVLAPALAGWDFGYIEKAFKLGLLECTDAVSLHAYGASKPEDAALYYSTIRSLISQYASKGREYPLVSGEWGYSSKTNGVSPQKQADYLTRCFLVNMMNSVCPSIWYDWRNDGSDPDENEYNFGTITQDGSPKPAYTAMQILSTELSGYSFAARISNDSDDDYLVLFRRGDDYRVAAWTVGKDHSISIPLDVNAVEVVLQSGERKRVEVKDGMLNLDIGSSVQYIEPLSKSKRWAIEAAWNVFATTSLEDGAVLAKVSSKLTGIDANGEISVEGSGLSASHAKVTVTPVKPGETETSGGYISPGESKAKVTITLALDDVKHPLVRVLELDTSACPSVEILPPASMELLVAVKRPAGLKGAFKGMVSIGNLQGIRLERDTNNFKLAPGEKDTIVHFKMTQQPAGLFSFSYSLTDAKGNAIVKAPSKRYSIVETFADGRVGEDVRKYNLALDGDPKVHAETRLTYVDAPSGCPDDICARLDYSFDPGWRFIRISPVIKIPIREKPQSVKIWVKADGGHTAARLRIDDPSGQTFQPNFGIMDFADWRCISADMSCKNAGHWGGRDDGHLTYPIRWNTIFLLDNVDKTGTKGTIYLGPMLMCYE